MPVPIAFALALALLVGTLLAGVLLRRRDGRRVAAPGVRHVDPADLERPFGARATMVQFSTAFCSRCPQVRRMLESIAAAHPGVVHAEVDLTERPDLATRYNVLSTPTTLLVSPDGQIRSRFAGVPDRTAVVSALDADLPPRPQEVLE